MWLIIEIETRAPSIQVNKKMMICQRPFSPTSLRKSSNLTTELLVSPSAVVATTVPDPDRELRPSFIVNFTNILRAAFMSIFF